MGAIFLNGQEFGGTLATPATVETLGLVKPDGTSITVEADGTIHSAGSGGGDISRAEFDAFKQEMKSKIAYLEEKIKWITSP